MTRLSGHYNNFVHIIYIAETAKLPFSRECCLRCYIA